MGNVVEGLEGGGGYEQRGAAAYAGTAGYAEAETGALLPGHVPWMPSEGGEEAE